MSGAALYRPDIDGLRALAVLSVLAFHAVPAALPGGFAGVDVFFVISGYLITSMIAAECARGPFRLGAFYNRRIKRLLPAYLLVSLATLAVASYLLIPDDYLFYTTSLATSWGFCSNIFFSLLSWGYFGQRTEQFPLLHSWSLSVEEQFYLLYPLLLVALLRRWPQRLLPVLLLVALAGLGLSQWRSGAPGAFFLLPYRAHELLAGALCALALARRAPASTAEALAFAGAGLALVLGALAWLGPDQPYPGWRSLAPVLGATALIYGGARANPVSRLLQLRPLVAIGLISYSLYLWHWPILAFLRYRQIAFDAPVLASAGGAALLLAWLSWRLVEQPVRRQAWPLARTLPLLYAVPAALFLAVGALAYVSAGAPQRFAPPLRALIASYSVERDLSGRCAVQSGRYRGVSHDYLVRNCTLPAANGAAPAILLFGDSHADHFTPFVAQLAAQAGLALSHYVEGGCEVVDLYEGAPGGPSACQRRNADLLKLAAHYRYVVLASRWQYKGREAEFGRRLALLADAVTRAGAVPVLIKDNPSLQTDLSRCILFRARGWLAPATGCDMPADQVASDQGSMDQVIDQLQARWPQLLVLAPKRVLCDARVCLTGVGNMALYKDANHLNRQASVWLGQRYLDRVGNPFAAASSGELTLISSAAANARNH